jgi:lipoprotein-anchoring transpeptidase ErfK/SrfK
VTNDDPEERSPMRRSIRFGTITAVVLAVIAAAWTVETLDGTATERAAARTGGDSTRAGAFDSSLGGVVLGLGRGAEGVDVPRLQRELRELGYRPATSSGRVDARTKQAVYAFQRVHGLESTGRVDHALAAKVSAAERVNRPAWCKAAQTMCVDVGQQVGYLRVDDRRYAVPVATGGDFRYTDPRSLKREQARTPRGVHPVWFKAPGHTEAPLGDYYWFSAFKDGYAVHGTKGIKNRPSSHGCVQVPISVARWVYDALPAGATVHVRD